MDETDGDRGRDPPPGDDPTPAIRRVEPGDRTGGSAPDRAPDVGELTGDPQTLDPAVQGVWIVRSTVSAVIISLVAGVAFSVVSPGGPWIGGAVFAVAFTLGVAHALARYRVWTYQVREDSLYLERGVLTRVNTVAPYVRIQHVDTRRGPVERIFGVATTVVYTAGSRGADVSIPGLTPARADDLQARLKRLAIAAEGEDAV